MHVGLKKGNFTHSVCLEVLCCGLPGRANMWMRREGGRTHQIEAFVGPCNSRWCTYLCLDQQGLLRSPFGVSQINCNPNKTNLFHYLRTSLSPFSSSRMNVIWMHA